MWTAFADLAAVKAPIVGLPVTESGKFVVTDPSSALVFRIGSLPPDAELAATRFLTRYNQVDDDEIADEDLVRETSESRLLCRTLCDFFRLHAGAKDGLTLVVFRNEDIQPILAGIDAYVRFLAGSAAIRTLLENAEEIIVPAAVVAESYSGFSILTGIDYQNREALKIKSGCFFPPPNVDSSVVVMEKRETPLVPAEEASAFINLTRVLFAQRRKTVRNNLKALGLPSEKLDEALEKSGISPTERAEKLTVDQILGLQRALR